MGITARSGEHNLIIGKQEFLETKGVILGEEVLGIITKQTEQGRTVILVASDATVTGLIAIADEIRPGTAEAVATLKEDGDEKYHHAYRG